VDRVQDAVGTSVVAEPEGPVFALLSEPDEETVTWMLKRRRAGQAAIAFLMSAHPRVVDRLTKGGWECVNVHEETDPGDAWRSAGHDVGVTV
jgi:hypothetical protein